MNKAQCTTCGDFKDHMNSGKRKIDGRIIYINLAGKQWWGKKCPDCYSKECSSATRYMAEKRAKKARACRECKGVLPGDKYFYHNECQPMDEDSGDTEWFGVEYHAA